MSINHKKTKSHISQRTSLLRLEWYNPAYKLATIHYHSEYKTVNICFRGKFLKDDREYGTTLDIIIDILKTHHTEHIIFDFKNNTSDKTLDCLVTENHFIQSGAGVRWKKFANLQPPHSYIIVADDPLMLKNLHPVILAFKQKYKTTEQWKVSGYYANRQNARLLIEGSYNNNHVTHSTTPTNNK